jgi:hypothetical protein
VSILVDAFAILAFLQLPVYQLHTPEHLDRRTAVISRPKSFNRLAFCSLMPALASLALAVLDSVAPSSSISINPVKADTETTNDEAFCRDGSGICSDRGVTVLSRSMIDGRLSGKRAIRGDESSGAVYRRVRWAACIVAAV